MPSVGQTRAPVATAKVPKIELATIKEGVKLISALMTVADKQGDKDGRVSKQELGELLDNYGDGASLDKALTLVHKYAEVGTGENPKRADINKALARAVNAATKADKNKNGLLSPSERKKLIATWNAVVDFSVDYKGYGLNDILHPSNGP